MYKRMNWWAQINFIKTNPGLVDGGRNNLSFAPRLVLESSWFRDETEDPQRWSNSTPHGPHRNWGSGDSPTAIISGVETFTWASGPFPSIREAVMMQVWHWVFRMGQMLELGIQWEMRQTGCLPHHVYSLGRRADRWIHTSTAYMKEGHWAWSWRVYVSWRKIQAGIRGIHNWISVVPPGFSNGSFYYQFFLTSLLGPTNCQVCTEFFTNLVFLNPPVSPKVKFTLSI